MRFCVAHRANVAPVAGDAKRAGDSLLASARTLSLGEQNE